MHTLNKNMYLFVISLSAMAGYVDAVGFLHLSGYFISFMSGNSTKLAVNLANNNMHDAVRLLAIILLFIGGTVIGFLVRHFSAFNMAIINVMITVTTLLLFAAICYLANLYYPAIAFMVMAMGAENAILQRNGDVLTGLTYMTGALVKIGQRVATAITGGDKFTWVPYLLLWLGLVAGGIAGALSFKLIGLKSLLIALLWSAALTFISIWKKNKMVV